LFKLVRFLRDASSDEIKSTLAPTLPGILPAHITCLAGLLSPGQALNIQQITGIIYVSELEK
jgi:hypothetical protein